MLTTNPDEFLAAVLGVAAGAESSHRFNVFGTENGYQSGRELLHGANGGLLVYGSVLSTSSSGGSTTTESLLTFVWFDRMDWNAAYEGDDEASGIGDQIGRIPFVEPVAYDVMISWSSNVSVTHGSGPAQASGWPFDTPITCVPAGDTYLSC